MKSKPPRFGARLKRLAAPVAALFALALIGATPVASAEGVAPTPSVSASPTPDQSTAQPSQDQSKANGGQQATTQKQPQVKTQAPKPAAVAPPAKVTTNNTSLPKVTSHPTKSTVSQQTTHKAVPADPKTEPAKAAAPPKPSKTVEKNATQPWVGSYSLSYDKPTQCVPAGKTAAVKVYINTTAGHVQAGTLTATYGGVGHTQSVFSEQVTSFAEYLVNLPGGTSTVTYSYSDGQKTYSTSVDAALDSCAPPPTNHAPVAKDDSTTTDQDTPVTFPVLNNDSDADGDTLTVTKAVPQDGGQAEVVSNEVRFTPPAGKSGTFHVSYTITDGKATASATLTVTVKAKTPPPPKCTQATPTSFTYAYDGHGGVTMTPKQDVCKQDLVGQLYNVPSTYDGNGFDESSAPQSRVDQDTKSVSGTKVASFSVDLSKLIPFKKNGQCWANGQIDVQNAPGQAVVNWPAGSSQPLYYYVGPFSIQLPDLACGTTPPPVTPQGYLVVTHVSCKWFKVGDTGIKPVGANVKVTDNGQVLTDWSYQPSVGMHVLRLIVNGKVVDTKTIVVTTCAKPTPPPPPVTPKPPHNGHHGHKPPHTGPATMAKVFTKTNCTGTYQRTVTYTWVSGAWKSDKPLKDIPWKWVSGHASGNCSVPIKHTPPPVHSNECATGMLPNGRGGCTTPSKVNTGQSGMPFSVAGLAMGLVMAVMIIRRRRVG